MDAQRDGSFEPYLPRLVRDWAARTPAEPWRELDGSLVSVDLSGFTALAERLQAKGRAGAEELVLAISGVFEGLIGIANRRGGDVLKFRGDALLILFSGRRARRASLPRRLGDAVVHRADGRDDELGRRGEAPDVDRASTRGRAISSSSRRATASSWLRGRPRPRRSELEDEAEAGEVLVSPATAAAVEPEWLAGERGGAALLALDREPDAAAPPVAEESDRTGCGRRPRAVRSRRRSAPTSGSKPARRSIDR